MKGRQGSIMRRIKFPFISTHSTYENTLVLHHLTMTLKRVHNALLVAVRQQIYSGRLDRVVCQSGASSLWRDETF